MYNVCCEQEFYKFNINKTLYVLKKPNFVFVFFLNILTYILIKLHITYLRISIYKCCLHNLCKVCLIRKRNRHQFYHLLNFKTEYKQCIKYYFNNIDCDYPKIVENTIYDLELSLRDEFSNQYYNGYMDSGHQYWYNYLKFSIKKTYSNNYWKEHLFNVKYNTNTDSNNIKSISKKYDLRIDNQYYNMTSNYIYNNNDILFPYDLEYSEKEIDDRVIVSELSRIKQFELEWF